MATPPYSIQVLQAESGIPARTLREWIRRRLLPKPSGRGRAARYDDRHLVRARVVQHLRIRDESLAAIRARIAALSEQQLLSLLPPAPRPTTPEGVPLPPPAPTYPSISWEVVHLMDGISLMVNPNRGPAVRRIADEIYRYYGAPVGRTGG